MLLVKKLGVPQAGELPNLRFTPLIVSWQLSLTGSGGAPTTGIIIGALGPVHSFSLQIPHRHEDGVVAGAGRRQQSNEPKAASAHLLRTQTKQLNSASLFFGP